MKTTRIIVVLIMSVLGIWVPCGEAAVCYKRYAHYKDTTKTRTGLLQSSAALSCQQKGGWLASIKSKADVTQMTADLGTRSPFSNWAITGGSSSAQGAGAWKWKYGPQGASGTFSTGAKCNSSLNSSAYCNWKPGYPVYNGNVLYLYPSTSSITKGDWVNGPNPMKGVVDYVCEFCAAIPPSKSTGCKQYVHYNYSKMIAQPTANSLCQTRGGWLAAIDTSADFAQLKTDVGNPPPWAASWALTGGSDNDELGEWAWDYGAPGSDLPSAAFSSGASCSNPSYCNWGFGEPSANGDIVYLGDAYRWVVGTSYRTTHYLCEFSCSSKPAARKPSSGKVGFIIIPILIILILCTAVVCVKRGFCAKESSISLLAPGKQHKKMVALQGLYRVASEYSRTLGFPNPIINPVALNGAAGDKFYVALHKMGYANIDELLNLATNYTLGFHGTKEVDAIVGIFKSGFDPNRRGKNGQVHGPGEYFDISKGEVASQYKGKTECLIVSVIITKHKNGSANPVYKEAKFGNSPIAIVNNPKSNNIAYQIPVAVVSADKKNTAVVDAVKKKYAAELRTHDQYII